MSETTATATAPATKEKKERVGPPNEPLPTGWKYASDVTGFRDNKDGSVSISVMTVLVSDKGTEYANERLIRLTSVKAEPAAAAPAAAAPAAPAAPAADPTPAQ